MTTDSRSFEDACVRLHNAFFEKHPDDKLQRMASMALKLLLKHRKDFPGKPEGWAAGTILAVCGPGGVPQVLNAEIERMFGASMSTIRKREAHVRLMLEDYIRSTGGFTVRDEADAIYAYAVHEILVEELSAKGRISDDEMEHIRDASRRRLATFLVMKEQSPDEYSKVVRQYVLCYGKKWAW